MIQMNSSLSDRINALYNLLQTPTVLMIPIDFLHPHPAQPRKYFDPDAMEELKNDIQFNGILNPLLVVEQPHDKDHFFVISGERRLRAARELGLGDVPCLLLKKDEPAVEFLGFSLNTQKEFQVYEKMMFYWRSVHLVFNMDHPEITLEMTGRIIRYLGKPDRMQKLLLGLPPRRGGRYEAV